MGRIIEVIVLVVLIIITAYYYVKAKKEADALRKEKEQEKVKIIRTVKIEGMMCEKCASKVTEALSKFGIVTVNLDKKIAVIEADELPDGEEIEEIIKDLGFEFMGIE